MPKFDRALAGGKAISGGSLAPRSRRGNTNQTDAYWKGGVVGLDLTAYNSIATTTVGSGGVGTVTFSSIPATYKHLQIRIFARGTSSSGGYPTSAYISINSDATDANFTNHTLSGDGATVATNTALNNRGNIFVTAGTNGSFSNTSTFTVSIIDFLNYADTNTYTTIRSLQGGDFNGAGTVRMDSMYWKNTAAITSISFITDPTYLGNYAQYSSFALYGIKG